MAWGLPALPAPRQANARDEASSVTADEHAVASGQSIRVSGCWGDLGTLGLGFGIWGSQFRVFRVQADVLVRLYAPFVLIGHAMDFACSLNIAGVVQRLTVDHARFTRFGS